MYRLMVVCWFLMVGIMGPHGLAAPTTPEVEKTAAESAAPSPPVSDSKPKDPAVVLPWEKPPRGSGGFQSARDLLANFGVEQADLYNFLDKQPLNDLQQNILIKVLYNTKRFRFDQIQEWRSPLDWAALLAEPSEFRAELFEIKGQVVMIERIPFDERRAMSFESLAYYRVRIQPEDAPYAAVVYLRKVPAAWKIGEPVRYTARTDALFLKLGDTTAADDDALELIFVGVDIQWFPIATDEADNLSPDLIYLSEHGVDIGQMEEVRSQNGQPLTPEDRQAFYQMLAAARSAEPGELRQHAAPMDLAGLLTKPQDHHGELVLVRGVARKITRIEVTEPDIRERYGIDHYYQINLFLPLGKKSVVLGADPQNSPVFHGKFPAVVCVTEVSPELARQALQAESKGQIVDEEITVPTIFYRLWSYPSEFVKKYDENGRQPAPMFIGRQPQMAPAPVSMGPWVGIVAGVFFVIALGAVWLGVWRFSRNDAKFQRETLKPKQGLPPGASLNELNLETKDGPDFSNLK